MSAPVALHAAKPAYTAEAMRARLMGSVKVECVVQPDGRCTDIRVIQSLDRAFGLDEQAVIAARAWRFQPGTRLGEPVPVWVTIELEFRLY